MLVSSVTYVIHVEVLELLLCTEGTDGGKALQSLGEVIEDRGLGH